MSENYKQTNKTFLFTIAKYSRAGCKITDEKTNLKVQHVTLNKIRVKKIKLTNHIKNTIYVKDQNINHEGKCINAIP